MNNIFLLFESKEIKQHSTKNNVIQISANVFRAKHIYFIVEHINWMKECKINSLLRVIIKSRNIQDNSVICVLETIIAYAFSKWGINIKINFMNANNLIIYQKSVLSEYNNIRIDKKFVKLVFSPDYRQNKIRFILYNDECKKNIFELSKKISTINMALSNIVDDKKFVNDVSDLCSELLNNCIEHSNSDTLVEITLTDGYQNTKKGKVLLITFLSYTDVLIETELLEVINKNELLKCNGGHIVNKALIEHAKMFSDDYDLSDFALVSTFQKDVSTRKSSEGAGGKGLTKLINSLYNRKLHSEHSYLLDGSRTIYFKKDYLEVKSDGSIGFNDNNNYYGERPSPNILKKEPVNFPGIIYNISIMYSEEGF